MFKHSTWLSPEAEGYGKYTVGGRGGKCEKTDDYYSMLDKLNNYMEKKYGISMKEEERRQWKWFI